MSVLNPYKVVGVDTSDATAAAADILSGKTAYVDGEKVTGELYCLKNRSITIHNMSPRIIEYKVFTISNGNLLVSNGSTINSGNSIEVSGLLVAIAPAVTLTTTPNVGMSNGTVYQSGNAFLGVPSDDSALITFATGGSGGGGGGGGSGS